MENQRQGGSRSIEKRFGSGYCWQVNDRVVDLYDVISRGSGAPGGGWAAYPWALDNYERVLRLAPTDTWLLKRLLRQAWKFGDSVYFSQRKLAMQASITPKTIRRSLRKLERLGYIRRIGTREDGMVEYSVVGLYIALMLCVLADPSSPWAEENEGPVPTDVVLGRWGLCDSAGKQTYYRFDLDLDALYQLANRKSPFLFDLYSPLTVPART
jgi:DNA-binding HxlR family transcriptional regulator